MSYAESPSVAMPVPFSPRLYEKESTASITVSVPSVATIFVRFHVALTRSAVVYTYIYSPQETKSVSAIIMTANTKANFFMIIASFRYSSSYNVNLVH